MAFVAVGGAIAGSVVGNLLNSGGNNATGSGGGGGNSGSTGVSPGQDALAQSQANLANWLTGRMQGTFAPLQDQYIAAASEAGTPDSIAAKMGAAHGTAMQAAAQGTLATNNQLAARGVSPNSPQAAAFTQDANTAAAANDASAQTAARDAEIQRGLNLKQAAIGFGANLDQTSASAGSAASSALNAGANQYNQAFGRNQIMANNTGYAIAPIAKALGTAAGGWLNSGSGYVSSPSPYLSGASSSGYNPASTSYDPGSSYAGGQDYYSYADGGIIGAARRGIPGYRDGEIITRAGMDAAAQADLVVNGGIRRVSEPAPAAAPMSQSQFSNAGAGPRRLTDAEREAKMQQMDRNRPPPKKFASGGVLQGPGGPRDDAIPALVDGQQPIAVSNGEAILNEPATSSVLGHRLVDIINKLGSLRHAAEEDDQPPHMPGALMARRGAMQGARV